VREAALEKAPCSSYSLGSKTIYTNPETGKQVVYCIIAVATIFASSVEGPSLPGKRRYLDPEGNPILSNKTVERPDGSTKETGKSQAEYNADSHYSNSD
jgi:hypothetical protein